MTPWIAIFDPDETTTAQRGMYIVYLFAEDMRMLTLSLNHGVTDFVNQCRLRGENRAAARHGLSQLAGAIRESLPEALTTGLEPSLDLHSNGPLQRDYVSGHVLGIPYEVTALPDESRLRDDLRRMLRLYDIALDIRASTPSIASAVPAPRPQPRLYELNPNILVPTSRNDSNYLSHLLEREFEKSRRHETLVNEFIAWAQENGLDVGTNVYPVDALLRNGVSQWLVEAEFVYAGNASRAFREAIGQLIEYQYKHYRNPVVRTYRLAVFSEPIGAIFSEILDSESTASIWKSLDGTWVGSELAIRQGLPARKSTH